MVLNLLMAFIKSFLHMGSVKMVLILCFVAGIVYLMNKGKERVEWR
ncbi:hypothetical protein [Peribacillus asahii]|nr:hypothetical protein [Peribacillus asahii]